MSAVESGLMGLDEAAALIRAGHFLMIAGDEALLRRLPAGNWIGGTIPYFMGSEGGQVSLERLFVTCMPADAGAPEIRCYDITSIDHVCADGPANGFSLIIIPAFTAIHSLYARKAPGFEDMFIKPVVGWVAGCHVDDIGRVAPLVVSGPGLDFDAERAVVMHVPLPDDRFACVHIANAMGQGDGGELRFPETGFSAGRCTVDGVETTLAAYLKACQADLRLPLVADYGGASVNVSIKGIDPATGRVDFYAPVFDDVVYRLAAPVDFAADPAGGRDTALWSCNCILNYLYCGLEGRRGAPPGGAMTFGEIAYLLLNQTQVFLEIEAL